VKEDSLIEEGFDLFLFPGDAGFAFFLSVGTLEAEGGYGKPFENFFCIAGWLND